MKRAKRIENLPPYLFAEIDKMIANAEDRGVDVISFGIGDPDQPTPDHIVETMKKAVEDPATHSYPSYEGLFEYRKSVSEWYKERFNCNIDPEDEVVSLIGSKEGIAHLPYCYINPGDIALVPDPAYPVYKTGVLLAGGEPVMMPLTEKNNFLPDLDAIDSEVAQKAKIMYLNYPNNPTGATADLDFFARVVDFAHIYEILIVHDAAYSEIAFDNCNPPSMLQIEGAKEVSIEFGSLSKTFNMTGWRLGWAVGNSKVINNLGIIKTNIDSGAFEAIQRAGITALRGDKKCVQKINRLYKTRRDILVDGLKNLGWEVEKNKATFYLWARVPNGYSSKQFSEDIFKKTGVFITPGIGYGKQGEDFVRMALTVTEDRIKEALQRFRDISDVFT